MFFEVKRDWVEHSYIIMLGHHSGLYNVGGIGLNDDGLFWVEVHEARCKGEGMLKQLDGCFDFGSPLELIPFLVNNIHFNVGLLQQFDEVLHVGRLVSVADLLLVTRGHVRVQEPDLRFLFYI